MIRPIDNQILYLQTVELSHRQQSLNKSQDLQQQQFSDIINKEIKETQETVKKSPSTEKVTNNLKKENQSRKQKKQKKQKHILTASSSKEDKNPISDFNQGFDLKI